MYFCISAAVEHERHLFVGQFLQSVFTKVFLIRTARSATFTSRLDLDFYLLLHPYQLLWAANRLTGRPAELLNGWPPGAAFGVIQIVSIGQGYLPADLVARTQPLSGTVIVKRKASERIRKGWNILSVFVKAVLYFHDGSERGKKVPWC